MEIDLHQARTHLALLIERTMAGEEIIIVKEGRAVVRMLPADPGANTTGTPDPAESEIADLFSDALGG